MSLPRFISFTSDYTNHKYLEYLKEDVDEMRGFLKFSGEYVLSSLAKYEVTMAKCGNGLVHIRCCYNNKYWRRSSENDSWIVAAANEPDEDKSKWSCTLFEPVNGSGGPDSFQFRHVQLGNYLYINTWEEERYHSCINASGGGLYLMFRTIDWESLLKLPKYVAFKQGDDHSYLNSIWTSRHPYLHFSGNDIGKPTVGNEVFPRPNGSILIKNNHFGQYWRRNKDDWILTDSDGSPGRDAHIWFWPIKVEKNVIALRNGYNMNFCQRVNGDWLRADVSSVTKEARIEVEELVLSRSIYNVDYHLMDDRIYDKNILTMATADAVNNTRETNQVEVKLKYKETKHWSWSGSISLHLGYTAKLTAGIPKIVDGKVELSASFDANYEWGKTEETESEVEVVYKATVPAMTRMKVKLVATKGSCDVPFSYSQRDTLLNGQIVTYDMDDGLYTGINCFYFKYENTEEKL